MKFRKKPVVIEAWRCSQLLRWSDSAWAKLPPQVVAQYEAGNVIFGDTFMLINTLEGQHRAEFGDMVICGVKGELYPCKPDIFAATYEPVEPPPFSFSEALRQEAAERGEEWAMGQPPDAGRCERCDGTGKRPVYSAGEEMVAGFEPCPACGGSGSKEGGR